MLSSLCVLLASLFTSGMASASPIWEQTVDRIVNETVTSGEFTGTVLIGGADGILYEKSFGFANVETQSEFRPTSLFRIASITKPFIATAVLSLVADGVLDLHSSVNRFLPELPASYPVITVTHLLTHSAGVKDYTNLPDFDLTSVQPTTLVGLARDIGSLPVDFEPGSRSEYSNSGYVLLALLLERVTGLPYQEVVARRVFAPASLQVARFDSEGLIAPSRVAGYRFRGPTLVVAPFIHISRVSGAGDILASARDLWHFDRALAGGRIIPGDLVQAMNNPLISDRSLGWKVDSYGGERRVWHGGHIHGFKSEFHRYVDRDLAIVVLNNHEVDFVSRRIAERVADVVLQR